MKYFAYIPLVILMALSTVFSAEKGALTADMLNKIESGLKMDGPHPRHDERHFRQRYEKAGAQPRF